MGVGSLVRLYGIEVNDPIFACLRTTVLQPGEYAPPRRKLGSQFPVRNPNVGLGLQVQPEPGLHAEEQPEPKRGVGGNGAPAVDQFAYPAGRDVDVRRELASADAHGLHEVLQQDLARMNLFEQLGHVPHS
jgi:hypothetical protein